LTLSSWALAAIIVVSVIFGGFIHSVMVYNGITGESEPDNRECPNGWDMVGGGPPHYYQLFCHDPVTGETSPIYYRTGPGPIP
jgi:hypothetical protein